MKPILRSHSRTLDRVCIELRFAAGTTKVVPRSLIVAKFSTRLFCWIGLASYNRASEYFAHGTRCSLSLHFDDEGESTNLTVVIHLRPEFVKTRLGKRGMKGNVGSVHRFRLALRVSMNKRLPVFASCEFRVMPQMGQFTSSACAIETPGNSAAVNARVPSHRNLFILFVSSKKQVRNDHQTTEAVLLLTIEFT